MSTMKSEKSESIESEILFTDMIWINTAHSFSYLIKYFFFHKPFFFFFPKTILRKQRAFLLLNFLHLENKRHGESKLKYLRFYKFISNSVFI